MFTKLTLKNFKSFGYIELDLTGSNGVPKNLAIIYGENGMGKSNLMSGFVLLQELMSTMNIRDIYQQLLNQEQPSNSEFDSQIKKQLASRMRDMKIIIDDYRLVGSKENMEITYEFEIADNNKGIYTLEFDDNELIHEKLEYILNRNRSVYFDLSKDSRKINSRIFADKDFYSGVETEAKRFWGKHSFFAILTHEKNDKSDSFFRNSLTDNFADVLAEFMTLSCFIQIGNRHWSGLGTPYDILSDPIGGTIIDSYANQLNAVEKMLTSFFCTISPDITRVFYKKENAGDGEIAYSLFFEKMIAGEKRIIDFQKESTGNHQLLRVLCYLVSATLGYTVIIDEADTGIHDVLFQRVLNEITPFIMGQLILTTHNTMLMELDFSRDATYIISEDDMGNKWVKCVTKNEKRIYQKNNIRNKYLGGEYEGIPRVQSIDFGKLLNCLDEYFKEDTTYTN